MARNMYTIHSVTHKYKEEEEEEEEEEILVSN